MNSWLGCVDGEYAIMHIYWCNATTVIHTYAKLVTWRGVGAMYVVSIWSILQWLLHFLAGTHLCRVISTCALQVKAVIACILWYCLLLHAASMVFNDNGRYYGDGTWVKTMYGAFSGPGWGHAWIKSKSFYLSKISLPPLITKQYLLLVLVGNTIYHLFTQG